MKKWFIVICFIVFAFFISLIAYFSISRSKLVKNDKQYFYLNFVVLNDLPIIETAKEYTKSLKVFVPSKIGEIIDEYGINYQLYFDKISDDILNIIISEAKTITLHPKNETIKKIMYRYAKIEDLTFMKVEESLAEEIISIMHDNNLYLWEIIEDIKTALEANGKENLFSPINKVFFE